MQDLLGVMGVMHTLLPPPPLNPPPFRGQLGPRSTATTTYITRVLGRGSAQRSIRISRLGCGGGRQLLLEQQRVQHPQTCKWAEKGGGNAAGGKLWGQSGLRSTGHLTGGEGRSWPGG